MNKSVKEEVLKVLRETIKTLQKRDYVALRDISNHIIKTASIFQDPDSIQIAVITFSLYKIITRSEGSEEQIAKKVINILLKSHHYLKDNEEGKYQANIKRLFKTISEMDGKLKLYIEEVIDQAQIKKGTNLYAQGISMARTSQILGVSQWELMSYIGKTKIIEKEKEFMDVINRLDFARSLFL